MRENVRKRSRFWNLKSRRSGQQSSIPGEDERLEADYKRMNSARNILENASEAYECTGGMSGDNASDMISRAIRCMIDASRYDDKAAELSEQLVELDGLSE